MEPLEREPNLLYDELIAEVKRREAIWNPRNKRHRSRKATVKAWSEIANNLNISEYAAKTKWKMLRTIFLRNVKRYKTKSEEDYTGRWRYFNSLWFLHVATVDIKGKRKNFTDFNRHFEKIDADSIPGAAANREFEDDSVESDSDNDNFVIDTNDDDDDINNQKDAVKTKTIPELSEEQRNTTATDTDELFLISLVPFLKKLDPMRNLVVRSRFQDILMAEIVKSEQNS